MFFPPFKCGEMYKTSSCLHISYLNHNCYDSQPLVLQVLPKTVRDSNNGTDTLIGISDEDFQETKYVVWTVLSYTNSLGCFVHFSLFKGKVLQYMALQGYVELLYTF